MARTVRDRGGRTGRGGGRGRGQISHFSPLPSAAQPSTSTRPSPPQASTSQPPPSQPPPSQPSSSHTHPATLASEPSQPCQEARLSFPRPHNPDLPWGVDPADGKKWIYPDRDAFNPSSSPPREISNAIKSKFNGEYYSWKSTTPAIRELWYKEWEKNYKWLPQYDIAIRKNWEFQAKNRLRQIMGRARQKLPQKPSFVDELVWERMVEKWNTEEFKKKSEVAKKNRGSNKGGSLYTGGSMPFSAHKRKLSLEVGRDVSLTDVYMHLHKKRGTNEFIDKRFADDNDELQKLHAASASQASCDPIVGSSPRQAQSQLNDDSLLVATEGINKKGSVNGLGSLERSVCSSSSSVSGSVAGMTGVEKSKESWDARIEASIESHIESLNTKMMDALKNMMENAMQGLAKKFHPIPVEGIPKMISPSDHPLDPAQLTDPPVQLVPTETPAYDDEYNESDEDI